MKSFFTNSVRMIALVILFATSAIAQEITLGTDFVSRYVWRGFDLGGNAPSIQPSIEFTKGGFTAGFWGAYSFANPTNLEEIDIYASYRFSLGESGSALSLGIIDYTNPNSGTRIGSFANYDDPSGPGAHYIEVSAGISGPESFPISLALNMFVHNVQDNPIYFELGYSTSVGEVPVSLFLGGTPSDNAYYGTTGFSLINIGFSVSKEIKITDSFSLPVFGTVSLNPASENLFYVLGISL
ncbi:MAG: hypothetical protein KF816_08795 [Melioribacteraceae bacterium]|nr:hypothetical protein [Melioribacteraceae bacterium]